MACVLNWGEIGNARYSGDLSGFREQEREGEIKMGSWGHSGFGDLLERARCGEPEAVGRLLQFYDNYLKVLANSQMGQRLRRRLSPSDLVQDTMLAACRDFANFNGTSEGELLGWLRQILIHALHRAIDMHVKAGKRDLRRELPWQEMPHGLDLSMEEQGAFLAANGTSPSGPMQARERTATLERHLAKLPEHYRQVIILRNLQGLPFEQIACHMRRSTSAIRMLWIRAMDRFKSTGEGADCDN